MSDSKKTMYIGKNNPFYGKHHSEETKNKFREQRRGKYIGENNHNYGKKHSEITRKRMSDNHADVNGIYNPRARQVYCIELNKIFGTIASAKEQTGFTAISACCNGICKSAGRHLETGERLHWLYVKDQIKTDGTIIQGAISLGYITQSDLDNYINDLKEKGDN